MIIESIVLGVGMICAYAIGRRRGRGKQKMLPAGKEPDYNEVFAHLLESCGFRIFQIVRTSGQRYFDRYDIAIGDREFLGPTQGIHGWRIAYKLPHYAECCKDHTLWRLAQPYYREDVTAENKKENTQDVTVYATDGLGPRVCAKCGRIERDYEGRPDGIGGLLGRATNIFPVLHQLARRDGEAADRARLALLENELRRSEDRREVASLEITQLRERLPPAPQGGPYRAPFSATDPPKELAAPKEESHSDQEDFLQPTSPFDH